MRIDREIILRHEEPQDFRTVELLTREAFWNHFIPGCAEHYLVHIMRGADVFIKELDFVAAFKDDGKIAGNIMYTRAKISRDDGSEKPVICFGPVSVLPKFQRQGIGTLLIEHTKKLALELGYDAILIYGDPAYYGRIGFVPAEHYGIGTADNMYAAPLQAAELVNGALNGCAGRFIEDSIYNVDAASVKKYDYENFQYKEEKDGLPSQERFKLLLGTRRPRVQGRNMKSR